MTIEVKEYYKEGTKILHREDGPAVEYANGDKVWYKNNLRHREDGPAVECWRYKAWYINGKAHREDGPAYEWADGLEWFINGKKISCRTNEEFLRLIKLLSFI